MAMKTTKKKFYESPLHLLALTHPKYLEQLDN